MKLSSSVSIFFNPPLFFTFLRTCTGRTCPFLDVAMLPIHVIRGLPLIRELGIHCSLHCLYLQTISLVARDSNFLHRIAVSSSLSVLLLSPVPTHLSSLLSARPLVSDRVLSLQKHLSLLRHSFWLSNFCIHILSLMPELSTAASVMTWSSDPLCVLSRLQHTPWLERCLPIPVACLKYWYCRLCIHNTVY